MQALPRRFIEFSTSDQSQPPSLTLGNSTKSEVYSTAMELVPGPSPAGEVRLFVARNVDVSEDVGKHIQELWMILKNIARDCLGARKSQNPKPAVGLPRSFPSTEQYPSHRRPQTPKE
ncbi:hypothetical protein BGX38DRAFT_1147062 [Terfezia claveryi]|nr:hypothetical protein BGX38DRAFT_1147062 [Terfezia claveryi]